MKSNAEDADDEPRKTHSRLSHVASSPAENWDDDFEFQPCAIDWAQGGECDVTNAPDQVQRLQEQEESWDDAYEDEDPDASPIKRPPKVEDDDVEDWDSSDNEAHDEHEHEREHETNLIRETAREFGAVFEEEDKTVTARSSSSRARAPAPLVAHLQHSQHPLPPFPFHVVQPSGQGSLPSTSPTISTFSIPISSNRASIYSQEPLMPNSSAPHLSLAGMRSYPQSAGSTPPRKGRRLRKKSRPPEADIFELEDREPDPLPIPILEMPTTPPTPPRPTTPPAVILPVSQPTPSPSLLTRIGSLKRWARRSIGPEDASIMGWRRPKSSTGPSETGRMGKGSTGPDDLPLAEQLPEQNMRSLSPTPAPGKGKLRRSRGDSASGQKSGWFFRAGGGGGTEKDDKGAPASLLVPTSVPRTPDPSPSKPRSALGLRPRKEPERDSETPTPRKGKSRLLRTAGSVFQSQTQTGATSPVKIPRDGEQSRQTTKHLSLQPQPQSSRLFQFPDPHGSTSVGRNAGTSLSVMVSDAQPPPQPRETGVVERESGMRSLMNGVRRLSLVPGGHKRTKSTGADPGIMEVPGVRERGDATRPRSSPNDLPKKSTAAVSPRRVSRSSTTDIDFGNNKNRQTLLPPVELNSPTTPKFERRRSLPWAGYEAVSDSPHYTIPQDPSAHPSPSLLVQRKTPPPTLPNPTEQYPTTQPLSASLTSLLEESPISPIPITPPQVPTTPQRSESRLRPPLLNALSTPALTAPSSPRPGSASATPSALQSASLGRSTASPSHPAPGLRRNSLGDLKTQTPSHGELKIPARISQAQQGLRRDLGMVREFAGCVEQLKRLQGTYTGLLAELRDACDASSVSIASRPTSPHTQFHLPSRPASRAGPARKGITVNLNPSMQSIHQATSLPPRPPSAVQTPPSHEIDREIVRLENEYGIWWECAELLVELGGGSVAGSASNPNLVAHAGPTQSTVAGTPCPEPRDGPMRGTSSGMHVTSMSEPGSLLEHTLAGLRTSKGPPQASPPSKWRASTGRHDLSARQLRLLRDMLNTPDPASLACVAGPYGYGTGYPPRHPHAHAVQEGENVQPWAPWNASSLTLPSEESSLDPNVTDVSYSRVSGESVGKSEAKEKRRRASRLGMFGLREILRGLKRNAGTDGKLDGRPQPEQLRSESSASANNSVDDDHYNRRRSPWHQHDEYHGVKPDANPKAPSDTLSTLPPRNIPTKSPRRPSLASIFRLGQKSSKPGSSKSKEQSSSGTGNSTTGDEQDIDASGGATGDYSDWERMSRSDLELTTAAVGSGTATVRGKRKVGRQNSGLDSHLVSSHSDPNATTSSPQHTHATSQTSLRDISPSSGTPPQYSKLPLSVPETDCSPRAEIRHPPRVKKGRTSSWSQSHHPPRPISRNGKAAMTGTVRSAPPDHSSMSSTKLALTPENIKPLLGYAKEVSMRLGDCIGEVQTLLSANAWLKASIV